MMQDLTESCKQMKNEILNVCPWMIILPCEHFHHFDCFYEVVFLCLCLVCDKRILYKMPDEIGEKRHNNDITMANLPVLGDVY